MSSLTCVQVAEENLKLAGVDSKVKILVGPARDTLPALQPDEPFDMAFIDADKVNNVYYFIEAKRMVRKGGIIVSNLSSLIISPTP